MYAGQVYGRLTVVGEERMGGRLWLVCRCDCGTEKSIRASSLFSGDVKSCGCFRRRRASGLTLKHGHAGRGGVSPECDSCLGAPGLVKDPNGTNLCRSCAAEGEHG